MTRAEMILKVVMSHAEPPNLFIDQYVRLVQGKLICLCTLYVQLNVTSQLSLTGNSLKKMSKMSSHFFLGKVTCPELPLSITK